MKRDGEPNDYMFYIGLFMGGWLVLTVLCMLSLAS